MGRYRKPFTLFKRGSYWYYQTYSLDGYRTTAKTTGQTTKTAAMNYCNELFKLNLLGQSDLFFGEYAEHFFDDNSTFIRDRKKPLSASSIRQHRQYLKIHLMPKWGKIKIAQITVSECKKFRLSLIDKGLANNTINGIFQTFNAILKTAYDDDKIRKNPLQGFGTLERPKNKDSFYKEEVKKIISELSEDLKSFFTLLSVTGMRLSECYGVTKKDVKKEGDILYIDLQKQMTETKEYTPLKTGKPRIIPITEEIEKIIPEKNYLFNHAYIKNHSRAVIRSCEKWQERGLSIHSFRHFFISNSKASGINNLIVESVAGHSLKGIEGIYTNFHATDLKELLEWQKNIYEFLTK